VQWISWLNNRVAQRERSSFGQVSLDHKGKRNYGLNPN